MCLIELGSFWLFFSRIDYCDTVLFRGALFKKNGLCPKVYKHALYIFEQPKENHILQNKTYNILFVDEERYKPGGREFEKWVFILYFFN